MKTHWRQVLKLARPLLVAGITLSAGLLWLGPAIASGHTAAFDWTMPARTGLDANSDGVIDVLPAAEISRTSFTVDFNACDSTGSIQQYRWTIGGVAAGSTASCTFSAELAEGVYDVTLETIDGAGSIASTTRTVTVQDWLIVAVGDSYGSGEGNPDRDGNLASLVQPDWQNKRCHRSSWAGQARAAKALEDVDPRTSVTLVHLACSGAEVLTGLLNGYIGAEPPEGASNLPPQLDRAEELIGGREVDALVMSIGGNDAGFGDVVMSCIVTEPCHTTEAEYMGVGVVSTLCLVVGALNETAGDGCNALFARVSPTPRADQILAAGLDNLVIRYGQLSQRLDELPDLAEDPSRVYITEYPNATEDDDRSICHFDLLNPLASLPGWSVAEGTWVRGTMTPQLNGVIEQTARLEGWTYVGGIFDAFARHGYCADAGWFVRIQDSFLAQWNEKGGVHPNRYGTAAQGNAIRAALLGDLYDGGDLTKPRPPAAPPDVVAPNVTGVPDRAPNGAGWYRNDVTIDWQSVDPQPSSGAPTDPPNTVASTEGAAVPYTSAPSCDPAGNCATGSIVLSIDKTAPTVSCAATPQFTLGAPGMTVSASVSDGLSGPAAATVSGNADTSSVGPKTVLLTGSDIAGNATTVSCSYVVTYAFGGFLPPVDGGTVMNVVKAGRAIPLKWRLTDAAGNPVTNLTTAGISAQSLSCNSGTSEDLVEETTSGGSGLQNLGDGYYQLNWKSPASYAGSCKTLRLDLGEGIYRTALFRFTR